MAYTTIDKPSDYFNTVLYTGNGSNGHAITGVGFSPNWVWIKERNSTSSHSVSDTVRGTTKRLNTDLNAAEETLSGVMQSFDSDGFTNGADNGVNENAKTYASWNWKAGGSASSNSNGSITSSVSANTTAGFSIVSYTGSSSNVTVGHGLGVTPKMIIFKNRNSATSWTVYHEILGNAKRLVLNNTGAEESTNQFSFGTSPTSSVFALGGGYGDVNTNGATFIAYCFAEKKGYSKFGSYTGNGNADGTFVYTGMKPSFVMVKTTTDAGYNWVIYDNKRVGFNPDNDTLTANENRAEQTSGFGHIDMVSNGFKIRASTNDTNRNANVFIYMAFAENPFVTSTGIPTTAR